MVSLVKGISFNTFFKANLPNIIDIIPVLKPSTDPEFVFVFSNSQSMHISIHEETPMQVDSQDPLPSSFKFNLLNSYNARVQAAFYTSENNLVLVSDESIEISGNILVQETLIKSSLSDSQFCYLSKDKLTFLSKNMSDPHCRNIPFDPSTLTLIKDTAVVTDASTVYFIP